MNFASYEFWRELVICFLASRLLIAGSKRFCPRYSATVAKVCLLLTGLVLLASESFLTLGCFAWVVALGWLAVLLLHANWPFRLKLVTLGVLLGAQLVPLFYYKYWNFVLNEVLGFDVRIPSVLIPMGLSFYTFQTIGFWIDQHRNPRGRPRLIDFLNFCAFFPQIVAGPIEKRDALLPQICQTRFAIDRLQLGAAAGWIVLGLAYKLVVADNLGNLAAKFALDPNNAWQVWLECLVFGFRIYFDFAGYSFIAVGLGLLFGIHLTLNFRCPYWARDMRVFWRDWHVTLGAWLRDYIYLPLGGGRVPWRALNVLFVFFASGIWHGAGWGFLIWGVLHGLGVIASGARGSWLRYGPLQWAATFGWITFAWLFFLERDTGLLFRKAAALFSPTAYQFPKAGDFLRSLDGPSAALALALTVLIALFALVVEGIGVRCRREPYQLLRHPTACVLSTVLIVLLAPMQESSFIYFNF